MLQVVVDCFGDAFVIELRDDGPEFDPTGVAMLDPEPGDETVGGWGLELVRRNVDDISYRREGGTNVLRLTRRLVSATRGE